MTNQSKKSLCKTINLLRVELRNEGRRANVADTQFKAAKVLLDNNEKAYNERVNLLQPEITRLRTALEAVCDLHGNKRLTWFDPQLWVCEACGSPGEECPTQVIVHKALDASKMPK